MQIQFGSSPATNRNRAKMLGRARFSARYQAFWELNIPFPRGVVGEYQYRTLGAIPETQGRTLELATENV